MKGLLEGCWIADGGEGAAVEFHYGVGGAGGA